MPQRTSTPAADRDLITIPELCRQQPRFGHPDTIYRLARTGEFPPAIKVGRRWLISIPRLNRYLHGEAS